MRCGAVGLSTGLPAVLAHAGGGGHLPAFLLVDAVLGTRRSKAVEPV